MPKKDLVRVDDGDRWMRVKVCFEGGPILVTQRETV